MILTNERHTNDCIVVAGMHRSGTSALTAALQSLGAYLGNPLLPPTQTNPRGYFEHSKVVKSHKALLTKLSRTWSDLRPLPADWERSRATTTCQRALANLLRRDFSENILWAVKDPRICRVLPMWLPILKQLNVTPRFIIPLRHPGEIADSLRRRDNFSSPKSGMLWMIHSLEAERATRGFRRCFVMWDRLLDAPDQTLNQVGTTLQLEWPRFQSMQTLRSVLDSSLRHADQSNHDFNQFGLAQRPVESLWNIFNTEDLDSANTAIRFDQLYSEYLNAFTGPDSVESGPIVQSGTPELSQWIQNEHSEVPLRHPGRSWPVRVLQRLGRTTHVH